MSFTKCQKALICKRTKYIDIKTDRGRIQYDKMMWNTHGQKPHTEFVLIYFVKQWKGMITITIIVTLINQKGWHLLCPTLYLINPGKWFWCIITTEYLNWILIEFDLNCVTYAMIVLIYSAWMHSINNILHIQIFTRFGEQPNVKCVRQTTIIQIFRQMSLKQRLQTNLSRSNE